MKKIWYLVADQGDGHAAVQFFQSEEKAQSICEGDVETYGLNETGPESFEINPDGTTNIVFVDEKVLAD